MCREADVYLPTPEQIRAACAEIQATWTDEEFEARRIGTAGALHSGRRGERHYTVQQCAMYRLRGETIYRVIG